MERYPQILEESPDAEMLRGREKGEEKSPITQRYLSH